MAARAALSHWGLIDNTIEGRQRAYFPHFFNNAVPLDPELNDRWRKRAFLTSNRNDQKALRKMCAEDMLFYIAGWVNIFDAGNETGKPGPTPFIPYEFQVECLTVIYAAMHDLRCPLRGKKPRNIGFTYMVLWALGHAWHWMPNIHLLVGSHREEEVDGSVNITKGSMFAGEWSKLLPKIDFGHIYMPRWLLPQGYIPRQEPCRSRMKIVNPENGSIIWGTSAAGVAGHGSRGYAAAWDEAARSENLHDIIGGLSEFAPCKLWFSTIGDLSHPFSTVLRDAPGVIQLNPEWWMHPVYSEGLTIDPETGQRSSPWLQKRLAEIGHDPILANQMYFADESKQVGGYYHPKVFETMLGNERPNARGQVYHRPGTVMTPIKVGELDIIDTPEGPRVTRFCEQPNGRWSLWFNFDAAGNPPRGTKYIQGADIAAGTTDQRGRGASNSVLCFADWLTGEVVAEFVTNGVPPEELARIAAAAGRWFEGVDFLPALTNFERNGPFGGAFGKVLSETYRYPQIWRSPDGKLGWYKGANEDTAMAFARHQLMLVEGRFIERSRECVREMQHYQTPKTGKGPPIHTAALHSEDPSGARDNHGDRVITRIVICQVMQTPYTVPEAAGQAPYRSFRYSQERKKRDAHRRMFA